MKYRNRFRQDKQGTVNSFSSEALSLFDKWNSLGTPASNTRKTIVNNTINYLKSANIWDELDFLYVWSSHSQSASLVDWKNPNTRIATAYGNLTFTIDSFWAGGTTGRMDLSYNPADGGTYKFTQNNCSMGVYIADRVLENKRDISALNGSTQGNELQIISTSETVYSYINSASQKTGKNYTGVGLMAVKRIGSSTGNSIASQGYNNGSSYTDTSLAIPNIAFMEFCKNLNGTYSLFTTRKHKYSFAGSGNFSFFTMNNIIEKYYLSQVSTAPTKRVILSGNSYTANGTYVDQLLTSLNNYTGIDYNIQGYSGYTTPQCQTIAESFIFPYIKSTITSDVYFVWELTNDMTANGDNATICYNNLVTYCQAIRTNMPSAKIIVATMMPRNSHPNRQNDADLYDDTTLNGKVRNHLIADGYCDYLCDTGSDSLMGQETQNTNLTYYNADQIHPNSTGCQRLVDNYIYPSISAVL